MFTLIFDILFVRFDEYILKSLREEQPKRFLAGLGLSIESVVIVSLVPLWLWDI